MPAGWRSWFVAGLLHLRLRVRTKPKSVDFHDVENRHRPCRQVRIVRAQVWASKFPVAIGIRLIWCRAKKRYQLSGNVGLQWLNRERDKGPNGTEALGSGPIRPFLKTSLMG
ncbi:hypothetical protein TNCV_4193911 [Trichonephila clavipes]|nr:hypothetical protein TNCV_4193911 [Trichonephila clavipes]